MIIADVPRAELLQEQIDRFRNAQGADVPRAELLQEQIDRFRNAQGAYAQNAGERKKGQMDAKKLEQAMEEQRLWEEYGTEKKKSAAMQREVGGDHYLKMPVQPWDAIDGFDHAQAIGFYRGSALAYIMRAGAKGPAREDYEKALHYLEKLLEIL